MLKTRIFTALCLLGLFLPALFLLPMMWWAAIMLVITLLGLREWAGLLALSPVLVHWYLALSSLLGLAGLYLLAETGFHGFFFLSFWLWVLASLFWLAVVPVIIYQNRFTRCTYTNLGIGLGLMLALWTALVVAKQMNPWSLLVMISTIWLADSAAYFAGKQFGRHKLAPEISPGKTWEGVWGALVAVGAYAVVLWMTGMVNTVWIVPGLWIITIAGIYGDLFESFYKRRANLKDSGQLLPGHGGLLDRIDGVMPAVPIGLCLLFLFHVMQQAQAI